MPTPPQKAKTRTPGDLVPTRLFDDSPTGTFEYFFDTDTFYWSDEMFALHGYEPGQVAPSLELGLSHFPPEIRDQAAAYWQEVRTHGGPLSTYLTLNDAHRTEHKVLIVGDQIRHEDAVVGVWGIMIDVSRSVRVDSAQQARDAVAASARERGVIEQAKGILMGQAGITADQAFHLISQHSQDTNRKVTVIARGLVARASEIADVKDHALATARTILEAT
ncbi:ANTAR domain-containing protein [Arthrobacter sp. Soc17.1.1.1]|uniref:ANTAR domain-containing protein n=1 Tax=Arthrobacter sp. Soc17.1.1.1 TaxID=3121277 RepID=UPI002FE4698B